ncbi:VOC family protein [Nonomuraea basaltis]|uniref:VOC family protein n=1 Tax=Nonomuraea basaltis TaxID=2495887 RepID=UPI00197FD7B9|nr:VOC family protein [Nonomuraea basaltis]
MTLDHLVYATPDLDATAAELERLLGVRAAVGGRHPGLGTRNQLIGLGGRSYLEIIGPDPDQDPPIGPRPFGIDELTAAALVSWAVAVDGIDAVVARARTLGYDPGDPQDMSRRTPAGDLLSWRLTPPQHIGHAGIVPFLIDWGSTRHPTESGLPLVELVSLRIGHPDPEAARKDLTAVGVTTIPTAKPHPDTSAARATPTAEPCRDVAAARFGLALDTRPRLTAVLSGRCGHVMLS